GASWKGTIGSAEIVATLDGIPLNWVTGTDPKAPAGPPRIAIDSPWDGSSIQMFPAGHSGLLLAGPFLHARQRRSGPQFRGARIGSPGPALVDASTDPSTPACGRAAPAWMLPTRHVTGEQRTRKDQ